MFDLTEVQTKEVEKIGKDAYEGGQPIAEKAKESGQVAVLPGACELFLDLDTELDFELFKFHVAILSERFFSYIPYEVQPSKSGLPHRHVIVSMPFKMDMGQRIGFQAALGSDRKRELLSMCEYIDDNSENHDNPVTLFEVSESALTVGRQIAK